MEQFDLIANRRREVEQEIARIKTRLGEMETELVELDTAGKVIARLSGAKWPPVSAASEPKPTSVSRSKTVIVSRANPMVKAPPMPRMIEIALEDARNERLPGLEPKEMVERIGKKWMPEPKGEYVSSIAWRMWKRGQLEKDADSPLYSLPKEKPADEASSEEQSAGLFQPARDGKPVQEVGHDNIS